MNRTSEAFLSKWPIFSLLDEAFRRSIKLVCVFGGTGNEAIVVTASDEMYSLGANTNGCLGVGDVNGCLQPRKVEPMCSKGVVDIGFGSGLHVVALTASGDLYSWGHNSYGQLGLSSAISSDPVPTPSRITGELGVHRVVKVACGGHHTLAVVEDGSVHSWGYNNCGQLGNSNTVNQRLPGRISGLSGVHCISVCCTHASSLALTSLGKLFSWGYNGNGQLGVGTNVNSHTPFPVHIDRVMQQIACGYAHVLGVTDKGEMYSWGSNFHGQLGTNNKTNHLVPTLGGELRSVMQVAASHDSHISCAALLSGKVYMWGMCKGQCLLAPYETTFSSLDDVFACFGSPPTMWRTIAPVSEDGYTLTQCIADRFNDTSTADLTIIVEGRRIHVHKAILRMRCDYFHSMFQQGRWTEADKDCIEIGQFPYSVYHTFLKFLYTDKLEDISTDEALGLLELTDSYCEKDLKRHCERLIWQNVTVNNVLAILASASKFRATTLEEQCMDFALGQMTQVIQSEVFDQVDPTFIKLFIIKAAERGAFKT